MPKTIRHYSSRNDSQCIIHLLQCYLDAIGNTGKFYRKALAGQNRAGPSLNFSKQVLGLKAIGKLTVRICAAARLQDHLPRFYEKNLQHVRQMTQMI